MRASFFDHLEELRGRLLVSLAAAVSFTIAAYFFSETLLDFLIAPLREAYGTSLYFHTPYEAFLTRLKVSVLAGTSAASPVIFLELWLFALPGLHRKERKAALILSFSSLALFTAGAAFAYKVIVPWGLQFFLSFETDSLKPLLGIGPYFSFLMAMVLATGIVSIFPVIVLGLVAGGFLTAGRLAQSRKWVVVGLFVLAAVITPSGDPASQLLLAVPLYLLFEICVLIARFIERKKQ